MSHRNPILQPKKPARQSEAALLRQTMFIMVVVAIAQGFVLYQCFTDTPLITHRMWTIGVATISCLSFLRVMMVLGYLKINHVDTTIDICVFLGLILSVGLIIINVVVPDTIYGKGSVSATMIVALSWMILISLVLCISIWKTEDKITEEITSS